MVLKFNAKPIVSFQFPPDKPKYANRVHAQMHTIYCAAHVQHCAKCANAHNALCSTCAAMCKTCKCTQCTVQHMCSTVQNVQMHIKHRAKCAFAHKILSNTCENMKTHMQHKCSTVKYARQPEAFC